MMKNKLPNLVSVLIIVLMAANYFSPFGDLDFAWQVRTGEQIVRTSSLHPPEAFSYTIGGSQVPDFEWLYEVILWLVWSGFGFGGLKFLRVVLVATPLILLALRLRRQGVRGHGIALALLLVAIVLSPAWNLRPLFCTTIGLLLVSGWLHDHCSGRRRLSWWLPLVMLLWGNLHPGVIAGQGMLLAAITWEWLNRLIKLNPPLDLPALKRLTLIGSAGLLASLICPGPLDRILYTFRPELRHPIQRIFAEMQPLYATLMKPSYSIALVYVLALLVLATIVLRFRRYRFWEVTTLAALTVLGNAANRGLQDWMLMMLALGVPHMAALLAQAARTDRRRAWVARLLRLDRSVKCIFASRLFRFQAGWPAAALAGFLVVSLIPPLSRGMPIQHDDSWPVAAVTHIERLGLEGRFFTPPDYGSLLIWRLPAVAKTYTDTRSFFYPPLLIEDSHFLPQLGPDWPRRLDRVLDEYHTDYFFLETKGPRGALWHKLQGYVAAPLYHDDQSVLLSARQVREGVQALTVAEAALRPEQGNRNALQIRCIAAPQTPPCNE